MDPVYLFARGDRLGGHILQYIAIIIYAVYNNRPIYYDFLAFTESTFVKLLIDFVDNYNKRFTEKVIFEKPKILGYLLGFTMQSNNNFVYTEDLCFMCTQVVYAIKSDLTSYFKRFINLKLDQPTRKTIGIHLRLGDVAEQPDYDGSVCGDYYRNIINQKDIVSGIVQNWETLYNLQRPLSKWKLERVINEAREKYPDHKIVIITGPGENNLPFDYPVVSHDDPDNDLKFLCSCDVLILSRSTFSLVAAFMGSASEIWCPVWGHFVCTGLDTCFDNSRFNYF
jgi:hypothetical protein